MISTLLFDMKDVLYSYDRSVGVTHIARIVANPRRLLVAVIQEARIGGVSTSRVDEIAQAMGRSGISKSHVSKLCKEIDERVKAFLKRPPEGDWPYPWLDATYLKVREGGRIVSVAAIIAVAANTAGRFCQGSRHQTVAEPHCWFRNAIMRLAAFPGR
jgi:Transposase, Mutator family